MSVLDTVLGLVFGVGGMCVMIPCFVAAAVLTVMEWGRRG